MISSRDSYITFLTNYQHYESMTATAALSSQMTGICETLLCYPASTIFPSKALAR